MMIIANKMKHDTENMTIAKKTILILVLGLFIKISINTCLRAFIKVFLLKFFGCAM
jgi:hypothetical protein